MEYLPTCNPLKTIPMFVGLQSGQSQCYQVLHQIPFTPNSFQGRSTPYAGDKLIPPFKSRKSLIRLRIMGPSKKDKFGSVFGRVWILRFPHFWLVLESRVLVFPTQRPGWKAVIFFGERSNPAPYGTVDG